MDTLEKQDITTGKQLEKTPILASAEESTAASSKGAPAKSESDSSIIASILALLQSDLADLQAKGLRVSILARDGKLYASIEWADHVLDVSDTGKKAIQLDGRLVVEYE